MDPDKKRLKDLHGLVHHALRRLKMGETGVIQVSAEHPAEDIINYMSEIVSVIVALNLAATINSIDRSLLPALPGLAHRDGDRLLRRSARASLSPNVVGDHLLRRSLLQRHA